ncbi:hypothetical protein JCM1393_26480 [Clostridium carnis]
MDLIFNNIDDYIIVIDKRGEIQFCNSKILKKLGCKESDFYSESIYKFTNESTLNNIKLIKFNIKSKISMFKCNTFKIAWKEKKCYCIILKEYYKCDFSLKDLSYIVENIPFNVWFKDCSGKYIYANKGFINELEQQNINLIGKKYSDFLNKDITMLFNKQDKEIIKDKKTKVYEDKIKINNKEKWYYKSKIPVLNEIGDVKYIFGISFNITEEKETQILKRELEKEYELESLRNEFFANISHEFKTPINIILSTIQLLSKYNDIRDIDRNKVNNYINFIKQNSYRLLRLVNNLIDITRIDTGYYNLSLGNHDIVSLIENITLSVANYIEGKGVNLVFDTNIEEKILACDEDKIERIMLNLLSNALKYTEKDGEILVKLEALENNVKVSVKDTGIGIEKDKVNSIFDRYKQIDNSITRKSYGSGIGLSIVKSLVEMHGGSINVESKINEGTKFSFEIPISYIEKEYIYTNRNEIESQIEKCNIEFSDIYSI